MTRGDLLRRIRATGGMTKTYHEDVGAVTFALLNGDSVPSSLAYDLIHMGRVVPQQDGLFGDSQVYKVRDA